MGYMELYRCFFFNNFYMAGIRTGIQAAHAVDEMWLELVERLEVNQLTDRDRKWLHILKSFAKNDKTFIVLSGGGHPELQDMIQLLTANEDYPWSFFAEPGLNDAITSVRVILPERMWSKDADRVGRIVNKPEIERTPTDVLFLAGCGCSEWEQEFLGRKAKCGLAD